VKQADDTDDIELPLVIMSEMFIIQIAEIDNALIHMKND
jgi:hypothetical protein